MAARRDVVGKVKRIDNNALALFRAATFHSLCNDSIPGVLASKSLQRSRHTLRDNHISRCMINACTREALMFLCDKAAQTVAWVHNNLTLANSMVLQLDAQIRQSTPNYNPTTPKSRQSCAKPLRVHLYTFRGNGII